MRGLNAPATPRDRLNQIAPRAWRAQCARINLGLTQFGEPCEAVGVMQRNARLVADRNDTFGEGVVQFLESLDDEESCSSYVSPPLRSSRDAL